MSIQRRSFIKYASLAAAGNIAGLRPFGALNALAQTGSDYKALVCLFLYGGNDGNNMVIPFDTKGYANYANLRGPLALAQNSLLQLAPLPGYALHPSLPDVQSLFNSGAAAIVANVGTLVQPLTRADYLAGSTVPGNLFSHSDQQSEWQNAGANRLVTSGWAGRVSDALTSTYNSTATIPMITSLAGDTVFCDGLTTTPVSVTPGKFSANCNEREECGDRQAAAQMLVRLSSGVSLVTADEGISANSYTYGSTLAAAIKSSTPLATQFPALNGLAAQLQQVAQIIQVRAALGVQRQIFFCGIGNFDTHSGQLGAQAGLLSGVSSALAAFYQATQEMGIANDVTTFTMSDFARTLEPNSNSGSDHAWGSHHLVVGGAVKGGQMYGTFPTLAFGGPDDSGTNGRWIPTTSSVQYAAMLGQWFGVPTSQLGSIFPNIGNFTNDKIRFV